MKTMKEQTKGFTLLELLIVISVLAILSVALILVLNPTESMRKSRDAQRINDLGTLKTAIGLYLTETTSPDLDGSATTTGCLGETDNVLAQIFYSAEIADVACAAAPAEGTDVTAGSTFSADPCAYPGASGASDVDGTGWLPVNLASITGGSPISNMPLDPVNDITAGASTAVAPTSEALVYRYACQSTTTGGAPANVFEINAQLESDAYTVVDDKRASDGGDNTGYYEVGTSLKLIGTGTSF